MKKFLVFALIAVLAINAADLKDTNTVLSEIDSNPFGNAVLSMIQLNIAAQTPLEQVNLILNQIVRELRKAQKDHNAVNASNQAACDKTTSDLNKQILYHTAEISSLSTLLADSKTQLRNAEADLRQTLRDIDRNLKVYKDNERQRIAARTEFLRRMKGFDETLIAIDEATRLVQHLRSGTSFAELQDRFDAVNKKLSEKAGQHNGLFKPLIASLTQLASKSVNRNYINRVIKLLARLRAAMVESKDTEGQVEAKAVQDWKKLRQDLITERRSLLTKKNQLEKRILNLKALIAATERSLANHRRDLATARALLASTIAQCRAWSAYYVRETNDRNSSISIIIRLQGIINRKLGGVKSFLQKGRSDK